MTARPVPPILPQDAMAFEEHARENLTAWFEYYKQVYSYMDLQEAQNDNLAGYIATQDQQLAEKEQEIASLKAKAVEDLNLERVQKDQLRDQLREKDAQVIEATVAARLAQQASLPTVRVFTPDASKASAAERPPVTHLGTTPPPTTESTSSSRLSEKLPDPDKFQATRADLRRFHDAVTEKLTINRDRYPTPLSRMAYVNSRLGIEAYRHVQPYIKDGICRLPDYTAVLDVLRRVYGDPNEARTARRQLLNLRQTNKDFGSFYAEFYRLGQEGGIPKEALAPLLENAISRELKEMLLFAPPPSDQYDELVAHFQELDTRHREHILSKWGTRSPTALTTLPAATHAWKNRHMSPARGRSPPKAPPAPADTADHMDLSNQRRRLPGPNRKENQLCYRCGSDGHYVRDCPNPDTRNTQVRSAAVHDWNRPSTRSLVPSSRGSTPSSDHVGNGVGLT